MGTYLEQALMYSGMLPAALNIIQDTLDIPARIMAKHLRYNTGSSGSLETTHLNNSDKPEMTPDVL
jgi:hypothetical protein